MGQQERQPVDVDMEEERRMGMLPPARARSVLEQSDLKRWLRERLPQGDSVALMVLWALVLAGLVAFAAMVIPELLGWNSPFVNLG